MIKENLKEVEARIAMACERVGRDPNEVTLIAVSKTKPVEMLQEAYEEGVREFGENKPQEMRDKYPCLPSDIHWHMIGHLQRNKIKYIIDKACMIHSVDSARLAQAISEEAGKHGLVMPVLIEVNMAKEESNYAGGGLGLCQGDQHAAEYKNRRSDDHRSFYGASGGESDSLPEFEKIIC